MKKIRTIIIAILLTGGIAAWKTVDNKFLKNASIYVRNVFKKSPINGSKSVIVISKSLTELGEAKLKVKISKHNYLKNGIERIIKVADFKNHSVFKTVLPRNLLVGSRESHYEAALKLLQKEYKENRTELIAKLRKQNSSILKRDQEFLKANIKQIRDIENRMLLATKNKDFEQEKILSAQLRELTNKINFKLTPRGQPIQFLDEDQILERQLSDIVNPNANRKFKVFGFTWHHNEDYGVMELVDEVVHKFNKHEGGYTKWGIL